MYYDLSGESDEGLDSRSAFSILETSLVSDIKFWKPLYQLFKPDEPLMNEALRDFYVRRDDSPVDGLVNLLAMDDTSAKFLLAGHRDKTSGSGQLELPKVFQDLEMLLRVGFQRETTRTLEVKPLLGKIVDRVIVLNESLYFSE
jgi:hypothetical protein